jgi:inner membrane protein
MERLVVKPSFANIIVWKIIYQTNNEFHVAAVKPGWFKAATVWPGDSSARLDLKRDFPWLNPASQQALDIRRFAALSDGYLAKAATKSQRIADIRYSMLPAEINPLWGIELSEDAAADRHVSFYTTRRDSRAAMQQLIKMMID